MHEKPKKGDWFWQMSEFTRLCLYSNLILLPGIITVICYEVFGILLNIPLMYVGVDLFVICVIRRQEMRRIARERAEKEEEMSGRAGLVVKQKLEELRHTER